jgi:hypothetical protein
MPKMFLRRDRVVVAASYAFFAEVAPLFKLHDDSDDRSFGYSDGKGDVPYTHLSVASEANNDVAMVAEECPS